VFRLQGKHLSEGRQSTGENQVKKKKPGLILLTNRSGNGKNSSLFCRKGRGGSLTWETIGEWSIGAHVASNQREGGT